MTAHDADQWQRRTNRETEVLVSQLERHPVKTCAQLLLAAGGIVRAVDAATAAAFLDVAATDLLEYLNEKETHAAPDR